MNQSAGCPQVGADDRSVACQLWESETGGAAAGFPVTGDGKIRVPYPLACSI